MSDDTLPTHAPDPAPETPAQQAKRQRTSYPIRICLVTDGALTPLKEPADGFGEMREALAWVSAHGEPGRTYCPARLAPYVRLTVRLEEVG